MQYIIQQLNKKQIELHLGELKEIAKIGGYPCTNFSDISVLFGVFCSVDVRYYDNYYYDGKIMAIGGLACYHGYWCLRLCVVRPEHRGQNLQKRLIKARVEYLKDNKPNAKWVNVWVKPTNCYSLNNLVDEGFKFMNEKPRQFDGIDHIKLRKIL